MQSTEHISHEIEIKINLGSFANYLKLVGYLGQIVQEDRHINGFFDTDDRALASHGWALRVRADGKRGYITAKSISIQTGAATIRQEIEAQIRLEDALEILNLYKDIRSIHAMPVDFLRDALGDKPVKKLIQFENTRQLKNYRIHDVDYLFEIDTTLFSDGCVDYELEVELPDVSKVQIVEKELEMLFDQLRIPFVKQTESKFSRALQRAGIHPVSR
ncbi:MAG: CYTH domain-containing protein [Candidatus Zixiibacteriota bacterium]